MKIVQLSAIDMTLNNFLKPLNKATLNEGIEVHCVCKKGPYYEEMIADGFKFHDINIDRKISPVSNLKSILKLVKLFKKIKPDIVHVHTPVASVLGRIAAKIAKVPVIIYTAHGFYFHEGMSEKKYKFFFNIEKYTGKFFTDYIFTQSEEDFAIAKENRFLKKSKKNNYIWISNGIDLNKKYNYFIKDEITKENLKQQYNIPKENIVVTFIGRLVKEKGILDFLESISHLKSKNVSFVIMGGLPDGERDVETFKELNKYEEYSNIIFTGHVNNADEFLYMSDIFCLPSYREGMPRSIIEAMAMKNAILATDIRGSREEVIHGESGFLFSTNDSKAIASYIDKLVENPEKLKEMKESGLNRARELYDEQKVIEKQLKVFNKYRGVK